jgi:hypothetical protein
MHYLANPSLLETPPETVRFEEGNEYSLPKPKEKRFIRKKQQNLDA